MLPADRLLSNQDKMNSLLFLFWSAFIVGLSGAIMPGPVLSVTIGETMKRGFVAGPLIVLGHAILELIVIAAAVWGLGIWIRQPPVLGGLGIAGGLMLLATGIQMILTSRSAAIEAAQPGREFQRAARGPILAGVLMSLANPYWTLWWVTIGLNYVALACQQGFPGLASFYAGHITADLAWYSLISAAVASGRRWVFPGIHRIIIVACGIALGGLGLFFLTRGIQLLIRIGG